MRSALILLAVCSATAAVANEDWSDGWRRIIRADDRTRLARLWPAWNTARAQVPSGDWTALGQLVEPLPHVTGEPPQPGAYRCRMVKLGAQKPGLPLIATTPAMPCRIDAGDDGTLVISGGDGVQRSNGRLFPDGDRMVFLGAVTLRGDMAPFVYGRDPDRNQVGALERIGPARWRLALPWPRWQSTLDIIDIVPAA